MSSYDAAAVAQKRPSDFDEQVVEQVRKGLVERRIAGVDLGPLSEARARMPLTFLAYKAVRAVERPGLPLPSSIARLSAATRELFAQTEWKQDTNRDRAALDRIVIAMAALHYAAKALGIPPKTCEPEKPETKDSRLRELCAEVVAAKRAVFGAPAGARAKQEAA